MRIGLLGAKVYTDGGFRHCDVLVDGGVVSSLSQGLSASEVDAFADVSGKVVFPGFTDVHVHFREPGFSYKETIASGTAAAAHGGYTSVCTMPNLSPVPDCAESLRIQTELIRQNALINVYPYCAVTKGEQGRELSDMESLGSAVAFSDDGRGVQSADMMEAALIRAAAMGKLIAAHCEDNSLLFGGYINEGDYARTHGHRGISNVSEYRQIERDIALCEKTGCRYHVCHISTAESAELIRRAKAQGVDITCETAPHYLLLDDTALQEDGRFKMNPPLRSPRDREALIAALCDGTIDMIATDHAPHSAEEKSRGLIDSLMGVVGLETAFAELYTGLVMTGMISLERLVELMTDAPRKRFGIGTELQAGAPADLTVFDLIESYSVDTNEFLSKGRATPFEGDMVYGRCLLTMCGGRIVWQDKRQKIETNIG